MKDMLRLFRVLYKNRYAVTKESNTGKRKLASSTVMTLSMLPMVAVVCVMLGFAAAGLTTRYSAMTLLNAVLSAVQVFILFMTLPSVMSTLYSSEDAGFLAALPMRPTAVFFAKLALTYVGALKTAAVFLIPSMLTVSVTYAALGNPMSYAFFPLIALIVLIAPVLPLFLIVLFSMPVMWINSRLKGRAVIKTVFSFVFYVLLMGAYMALVFYFNTNGIGDEGMITGAVQDGLSALAGVMYPNASLISMCLGIDPAKNFGISFGIWAGIALLTVLLAMLFYRRITVSGNESGTEERSADPSFKRTPLLFALIKRDFLTVIRQPSVAMGTFSNIVLAPVMMLMMYFFMQDTGLDDFSGEMLMTGLVLMYPVILLAGTNMVSLTAYSREGASFFIGKTLPIPPKTSVTAKLLFALMSAGVALIVIFVLAAALYRIDIGSAFGVVIASMLFAAGGCSLHIYFDIKKGNVNWKTQSDMRASAGGGVAGMLPVLIIIVPAAAFMVGGMFMAALEESMGRSGVLALYWCLVLVVAAGIAAAGLYILYDKGVPLVEKIGENRCSASQRRFSGALGRGGSFLK